MKKILSLTLCALTVIVLALSLAGCTDASFGAETYLQYGKKYTYVYDEEDADDEYHYRDTYVFNKDQTGTLTVHRTRDDFANAGKFSWVQSYTVKFKWKWIDREQTGFYIFETEHIFHADHDDDKKASISNLPFIIGEDFVSVSGGNIYILEDSDVFGVENELHNKK